MTSTFNDFYTLEDYCSMVENNQIVLPTIQRGFIWKPHQVENLWDSLMRGLPIGSFILNRTKDNRLLLLDGQQRTSSLLLGLHDKEASYKKLNIEQNNFSLFISLEKANPENIKGERRFILRAITRSHPWGYQRVDNSKPLKMNNISKAIKAFDQKWKTLYYEENASLEGMWPWESVCPVPVAMLRIGNGEDFKKFKECLDQYITNKKDELAGNEEAQRKFDHGCSDEELESIYDSFNNAIKKTKIPLQCPENLVDFEELDSLRNKVQSNIIPIEQSSIEEEDKDKEHDEDDDKSDEIETLFVRLNSAGTPLRGEELNYSLLKSKIDNDENSKQHLEELEEFCGKLIRPSRLLSIGYKLYILNENQKKHESQRVDIQKNVNIKPKEFHNFLQKDRKNSFKLVSFLGNKYIPALEHAKKLIQHSADRPYGLPHNLYARFFDESPEMALLLLTRIMIYKDDFSKEETHRRTLGLLTTFSWFIKKGSSRNRTRILNNIWPLVEKAKSAEEFWSHDLYKRAKLGHRGSSLFDTLPTARDLKIIFDKLQKIKRPPRDEKEVDTIIDSHSKGFTDFLISLSSKDELLLYAQRNFLSEIPEHRWHLEDTNNPYDKDHISPYEIIKGRRGMRHDFKFWYKSIGNLRAWPFSMNRHDQNKPLFVKFATSDTKDRAKEVLNNNTRNRKNINPDKNLLNDSLCDEKWFNPNFNSTDLKKPKNQLQLLKLILKRIVKIYDCWIEELCIRDIIESDRTGGNSKHPYNAIKKVFEETFKDGTYMCKNDCFLIPIKGTNLYLQVYTEAEDEKNMLQDNQIELSIWNPSEDNKSQGNWKGFDFKKDTVPKQDGLQGGNGFYKYDTLIANRDIHWLKIFDNFIHYTSENISKSLSEYLEQTIEYKLYAKHKRKKEAA